MNRFFFKTLGIPFVVYVVGIDLRPHDANLLTCIARSAKKNSKHRARVYFSLENQLQDTVCRWKGLNGSGTGDGRAPDPRGPDPSASHCVFISACFVRTATGLSRPKWKVQKATFWAVRGNWTKVLCSILVDRSISYHSKSILAIPSIGWRPSLVGWRPSHLKALLRKQRHRRVAVAHVLSRGGSACDATAAG